MVEKTQIIVNVITSVVLIITLILNLILIKKNMNDEKKTAKRKKNEYIFDNVLKVFLFEKLPYIENLYDSEDDIFFNLINNIEMFYNNEEVTKLKKKIFALEDALVTQESYQSASGMLLQLKKDLKKEIQKLR